MVYGTCISIVIPYPSFSYAHSWLRHPRVRENWKIVLASAVLSILGIGQSNVLSIIGIGYTIL